MKQINLNTTSRTDVGGNSAKRYRKSGQIPAVIYGESGEKNLLIDEKELAVALKAISGKAVLIDMQFSDGTESRYAMLKDVERNPITDKVIHVDFVEVVRGKPMHAVLPLHFAGEADAPGVKNENGIVEIHEHEVRVKCRPRDLPEMITIDISKMHVGEAIHLKDVVPPEGVEFTSNLEDILVTCNEIVVEEEPAPEAPAEGDAAAAPAAAAGAAPAAAPAADAKKAK
ncbi:50S ribosomal protein L25 [Opitutia bacterium KCR 482]|nr:50S ribosomal protein L25 [Opitutae bacterium KCR 482]